MIKRKTHPFYIVSDDQWQVRDAYQTMVTRDNVCKRYVNDMNQPVTA